MVFPLVGPSRAMVAAQAPRKSRAIAKPTPLPWAMCSGPGGGLSVRSTISATAASRSDGATALPSRFASMRFGRPLALKSPEICWSSQPRSVAARHNILRLKLARRTLRVVVSVGYFKALFAGTSTESTVAVVLSTA
eukprot:8069967-Pyramimonas_sp.AAC.1